MDKCFVLEKAAIASWRIFYVHFIEREIDGNDVMYEFKLKASQFIFNGDFERKFVDSLYIRHLFFLRLISTMGGEKDLSANIKRAFLVEEMAWPLERVFMDSPSPFAILPTISLFQAFGIAARTPA